MRSGRNLRSIPEPEYAGHRAATEKLRAWFTAHHFRVVQNLGENSNCLLISLLQHATGDYQSEHTRAANDYKALLASQSNGANRFSDGLFENTTLIARLIDQINADYGSDISAQFYVGNSSDEPGIHTVGTGKRPVIIFDQFGHFEAVVPLEKQ